MAGTTEYANSLFEQPWWLDIVAPGQWHEILIEEKGHVLARMPYIVQNNVIRMAPYTQNIGIWMSPEVKASYSRQKKIINQIIDRLGNDKPRININLSPLNEYVLPFTWRGFKVSPNFTYRLEDLRDIDAVFKGFSKSTRQNIRQAYDKVQIRHEVNIDHLWLLINKTYERQNLKPGSTKELVSRIVTKCSALGHGRFIEAVDADGNVHSCSFFVYDDKVCYDLMGGSDSSYNKHSKARTLVLWESIRFAAQHSRIYDFEGSMVEGIESLFNQFGGRCTPYYSISREDFITSAVHDLMRRSEFFRKTAGLAVRLRNTLRGLGLKFWGSL